MPSKRVQKKTTARGRSSLRRTKWGLPAIIGIAILGLGLIAVGTAALSQTLNINGTATVKGINWDVHFAQLSAAALSGKASETTPPTISENNTKIGDYAVVFNRPGDAVAYTIDVINAGDIDAEITSVTIKTGSGLTCTSTSDKADTVCANLSYTLKYTDGNAVAVGDALDAGATRQMVLSLALSDALALTDMPNADVTISGLDVVITYGQKAE